jgi:hypothetical protein
MVIKKSKGMCLLLLVRLVSLSGCKSIRDWWALDEYETPPALTPGESFSQAVSAWWDTSWYSPPSDTYNAVLTHAGNQYILDYSGTRNGEPYSDRLSAPSVDALISEMQKTPAVFKRAAIRAVRSQSRLIPADNLKEGEMAEIKQMLKDYYTDPSEERLDVLVKTYQRYKTTRGAAGKAIARALYNSMLKISPDAASFLLDPGTD